MNLTLQEQQVLQVFEGLPHNMTCSFKLYDVGEAGFSLFAGGSASPFIETDSFFDSTAEIAVEFIPELLRKDCGTENAVNAVSGISLCIAEYSDYGTPNLTQAIADNDNSIIDASFAAGCEAVVKAVRQNTTVSLPNCKISADSSASSGYLDIILSGQAAKECLRRMLRSCGKYFYSTCLSFEDLLMLMQNRAMSAR